MRKLIATLFILSMSCTSADVGVGPAPDASVDGEVQQCVRETSEYGYCPYGLDYEGRWDISYKSQWQCDCEPEELDEFDDTGIPQQCCSWNNTSIHGYMNVNPLGEYMGAVLIHAYDGSIFLGNYEMLDATRMYINKGYKMHRSYDGAETIQHSTQHEQYLLEFNHDGVDVYTASPPAYFEDNPKGWRLDFTIKADNVAAVTECPADIPERGLVFGHCHGGPVCRRLIAGCTSNSICHLTAKKLACLYGSWSDGSICDRKFYDPLMMGNYIAP